MFTNSYYSNHWNGKLIYNWESKTAHMKGRKNSFIWRMRCFNKNYPYSLIDWDTYDQFLWFRQ